MSTNDVAAIEAGLIRGERRFLAKAITLVESSRPADKLAADALLTAIMPHTNKPTCMRLGISGIPGVGKSTFIESLGTFLLQDDPSRKIGILAVDPSSPQHGGSILADKTRMETLASHNQVFIRPTPSSGNLGGVARKTRETLLLMEAAGYPLLIVETVGVGQSEHLVASMVDLFALLQMPATGDELQGIKRGILELADLVIVNKADGMLKRAAATTQKQLGQAFGLFAAQRGSQPPVLLHSAHDATMVAPIWQQIVRLVAGHQQSGLFASRRRDQAMAWFHAEINALVHDELRTRPHLRARWDALEEDVRATRRTPSLAARELIALAFAHAPS